MTGDSEVMGTEPSSLHPDFVGLLMDHLGMSALRPDVSIKATNADLQEAPIK